MATGLGGTRSACRLGAACAFLILLGFPTDLSAQSRSINPSWPMGEPPPIPPAPIPTVPAAPTPIAPEAILTPPAAPVTRPPAAAPVTPPAQAAPAGPVQIALILSARFGRDPPPIT